MRRTYLPPQSKLTIGIACTITRPQVTKMTNQQCKIPARVNYKTKVKRFTSKCIYELRPGIGPVEKLAWMNVKDRDRTSNTPNNAGNPAHARRP
jgi:hypothetical protein